jgi:hypothetical protein
MVKDLRYVQIVNCLNTSVMMIAVSLTLTNAETCYDKVFKGANSNMNHGFNSYHNAE